MSVSTLPRALAAGLSLTALLAAPVAAQEVQPQSSEIRFVSRQMGVPVEGRFRSFDAQLSFDPAKPEAGHVQLTIDLGSVALGHAETERELAKPTWLDVPAFPKARFESRRIRATAPDRYEIEGDLMIKGASQPLIVPVELTQSGATTTATGGFVLKRLDFRIGDGEWRDTSIVANEVQVNFRLTLDGVASM